MKTLLLVFFVALMSLSPAQQVPKRPLGVPADAKHFNGRWYKVIMEKKSWRSARDKCKELGGQLCTVPDAPTWEFVKTLNNGAKLWIGADSEAAQGLWKWSDGSPCKFTAWAVGQPDNTGNAEHYVAIFNSGWHDMPNQPVAGINTVSGFICEWVGR